PAGFHCWASPSSAKPMTIASASSAASAVSNVLAALGLSRRWRETALPLLSRMGFTVRILHDLAWHEITRLASFHATCAGAAAAIDCARRGRLAGDRRRQTHPGCDLVLVGNHPWPSPSRDHGGDQ